jgi:hypothetical protein
VAKQLTWTPSELALAEIDIVDKLTVREPKAATVKEYAQALRAGAVFPDVQVARIGPKHYLVDGRHRYEAHRAVGRPLIATQVARMTWNQASAFAAQANVGHGLSLGGQKAKRRAMEMFLRDPANHHLSSREVSKALGGLVGYVTVDTYRKTMPTGGLRGARDDVETGEAERAAEAAVQARVAEDAQKHLAGVEKLFGRMTDPAGRFEFLQTVRSTLGSMEAAGNAEAPEVFGDLPDI